MKASIRPVAVVTDSAASIPRSLVEAYGIEVVPYQLIWDGQSYLDGIDMSPTEFYRRFRTSVTRPSTTVPTAGQFVEAYRSLGAWASGIVGVFVSQGLTSVVQVATLAAQEAPVPVRVVDSRAAAMAEGFVALHASRVAHRGGTLEEVAAAAEECRGRAGLLAAFQTLEHLIRGGRAGRVARAVSNRIRLEPVITIADGTLAPVAVTRSHSRSAERMVAALRRIVGERRVRASVLHADLPEDAAGLAEQVRSGFNCVEFFISELTPVMGAHTGPALLGIAYCLEEEAA